MTLHRINVYDVTDRMKEGVLVAQTIYIPDDVSPTVFEFIAPATPDAREATTFQVVIGTLV